MRIRSVHPRFWRSLTLARLTRDERLFFIGLWSDADDGGRGVAEPRLLKGALFSMDDDVSAALILTWLQRLEAEKLVILYASPAGVPLYAVRSWEEFQRPERPKPSLLTAPPGTPKRRKVVGDESVTTHRHVGAGIGVGKGEGKGKGTDTDEAFEAAWKVYPRRPADPKQKAAKAWAARIKEGVEPSALMDGARKYAAYCRAERTEPKYIKMAATFFGPDRHWESDYSAPRQTSAPKLAYHEKYKGPVREPDVPPEVKALFGDIGKMPGKVA